MEEECNLIQNFDSCDEFEIMAVEEDLTSIAEIEKYIDKRVLANVYEEGNDEKKAMIESLKLLRKLRFEGIQNLIKLKHWRP